MRAYWLVSLAFVSLPAMAGSMDEFTATPGDVAISGPVEVALYTTPWGSAFPCVEVQVGDKTFLFALATGDPTTWISGDVAAAAGIKAKPANKKVLNLKGSENEFKAGGKVVAGTLPELRIGELTLTDVPVVTEPLKRSTIVADPSAPAGLNVDGRLSLTALDSVAWAVIPSKGVVRFAPAADGSALLAQVGGTPVDYGRSTQPRYKFGKDKRGGGPDTLMTIAATVGGAESPHTEVFLESAFGTVHPKFAPEGAGTRWFGDESWTLTTVGLGGTTVREDAKVRPGLEYYAEYSKGNVTASIGSDVLALFDIAADPASHKVTFQPTTAQVRQNPLDRMIAEAEKGLTEPAPKEGDEPKPADAPPWKPDPSTLARLAQLHELRGEPQKALAYLQQKKDLDERDCSGWHELGEQQIELGDLDGAVTSLTQASQLYHAWWDLPVEQRTELAAELGELDPEEKKAAEFYQEPSSCFVADGALAAALYLKGDLAKVEELVKTRTDLDTGLTNVAGNAYLVAGKPADAQAAYRQSIRISQRTSDSPRLGVGVAYAATGDWRTARELLERYIDDTLDTNAILFYGEQVRAHDGDAAALQALAAFSARHPSDGSAALAYYRQARRMNATGDIATAQERIDATFGRMVRTASTRPVSANYARYLVDQGNLAEAEKYVAEAERSTPDDVDTWFAKAEVAASRGNAGDAAAALQKVALIDPISPISALVKSGKFGPTVAAASAPTTTIVAPTK
jgi:tetratricopeptide (TPR) repeat protein